MDSTPNSTMMAKKGIEGIDKCLRVAVYPCSYTRDPLIQNYSNFKRTSEPKRVMFYDHGSWADYPEAVVEVIKLGFSEGKPAIEARIQGLDRFLDFYRMLEIELESGNQRSISWIDVDGKCFFPKIFINSYDNNDPDFIAGYENSPKIEIEIKLNKLGSSESLKSSDLNEMGNLSKGKREEQAEMDQPEESSFNAKVKRPKIVCEEELQSPRWPKTRVLRAEEEGYTLVKNLFLTGLKTLEPGAEVTVINQCVRRGPLDVARRQVFMKQMEITKQARGASNMVFAWYGTSAEGVESILMHGFGIPAMASRSEGHGLGIHLSPVRSPQNSALLSEMDENGEKHIILCKVILGKCEKIDAESRQSHPSSVEYDTGVDDLTSPKWYTVWYGNMNTHIVPECVVSYRTSNVPGSVNGVLSVNWVPPSRLIAKLLYRMKSYLPMPKFQELQTLCGLYNEGKLGKNVFMRQLRSVIGDDLLRSTIQEFRG
ncbi:inactive poly [ADP-ribose] polymerase RCD1-like isoform X1 [Primulina tabacum]|uniref:inactive poly [ADP-ribose] polymerase RCD1-like isoform X1 n=1 Tax=Primulina tabacum TaxID=48773 RepID=UPI003F5A711F